MSILEETTDPDLYGSTGHPAPLDDSTRRTTKSVHSGQGGCREGDSRHEYCRVIITINDVLAIVDSGLVREMSWNAESGMSTMQTVTTSRASAAAHRSRRSSGSVVLQDIFSRNPARDGGTTDARDSTNRARGDLSSNVLDDARRCAALPLKSHGSSLGRNGGICHGQTLQTWSHQA